MFTTLNIKNKFIYILRAAKTNFYKNKFNKVSYSPKLTWKVIKEVVDSKNHDSDKIKSVKNDGDIIYTNENPCKVANLFNSFFTNIGENNASNIITNFYCVENLTNELFDSYFNEIINESEVF